MSEPDYTKPQKITIGDVVGWEQIKQEIAARAAAAKRREELKTMGFKTLETKP